MMAAIKGKVIEAVVYIGVDWRYPKWFIKDVLELAVEDNKGELQLVVSDETDDKFEAWQLVPDESVIIRNKHGEMYHLPFMKFKSSYYEMGVHYAARREDCVEYFILDEYSTLSLIPEWILELIEFNEDVDCHRMLVTDMDVVDFESIKLPATFIRNHLGQVKYVTQEAFAKNFDVAYPRY